MNSANPWIHRDCEKCGHKQRTRAKKYWSCHRCGHKNYVTKTPHLKPFKKPRLKPTAVEDHLDPKESSLALLSPRESIPRPGSNPFFKLLLSLYDINLIFISI